LGVGADRPSCHIHGSLGGSPFGGVTENTGSNNGGQRRYQAMREGSRTGDATARFVPFSARRPHGDLNRSGVAARASLAAVTSPSANAEEGVVTWKLLTVRS
jgi:hypothetical protein